MDPSSAKQASSHTQSTTSSTTRPSASISGEGSDPFCNPPNAGIWLLPSSTVLPIGQDFEVDLFLKSDEASDAFMSQIQYRLTVSPNINSKDLDPVDSTFTLYLGDSEQVTFRLQIKSEGVGQIMGKASYELHALMRGGM